MTARHLSLNILATALIATGFATGARAVELVKSGAARAVIVLTPEALAVPEVPAPAPRKKRAPVPVDPYADVKLAATELVEHIERMSGAKLEIVALGTNLAGRVPIYLDQAADAALDAATRKVSTDPAAFTIRAGDKSVAIRGLSREGTLFGCYEALEQLGVRWFMPGEIGRVIPAALGAVLAESVTQVTLKHALTSYTAVAETDDYRWPLSALLPGVLRHFDLPDCYRELAKKNLRQIEPWDAMARPI